MPKYKQKSVFCQILLTVLRFKVNNRLRHLVSRGKSRTVKVIRSLHHNQIGKFLRRINVRPLQRFGAKGRIVVGRRINDKKAFADIVGYFKKRSAYRNKIFRRRKPTNAVFRWQAFRRWYIWIE